MLTKQKDPRKNKRKLDYDDIIGLKRVSRKELRENLGIKEASREKNRETRSKI